MKTLKNITDSKKEMSREDILKYLHLLNDKLKQINKKGEVSIVGGAVMCLCFESRPATFDIDAIYQPTAIIDELVREIACENNIQVTWLNDICYQFLSDHGEFKLYHNFSHLKIYTAVPEYMLAMKCLSGRLYNQNEVDDIEFLLKLLSIKSVQDVNEIIKKFFPEEMMKLSVESFIKEVLE